MRRALLAVLLFVPLFLLAQEVDEEELQSLGTDDLEFINYSGPYDQIDSIEEIVGIGRTLGTATRDGADEFTLNGRYRIINAVDPEDPDGLDADIFVPLATARVDHINNMRRIISGFLQAAYDYTQSDADLIARWVTIYNAVSRGNMEFYSDRYKAIVVSNLSEANAGLSRRFDEWPGQSRVVIPLSSDAAPGVLGTVDPGELGDERVVEELRSQDDRGIEDRQDMVDLTERVIEEQEEAIEEAQEEIQAESERIDEEEAAIESEREQIQQDRQDAADLPDDEREQAEREIAERESALDEREEQAHQDRSDLEDRAEDVSEDAQDVADLTTQVREEREQIARDTRALLDEREISDEVRGLEGDLSPVYFLQVRDESGTILGQLVQINPVTGLLLNRSSEDQIISRTYNFFGGQLLVIVADGDTGRIAQFDVTTLDEAARGTDSVFLGSALEVSGEPAQAYAVVEDQGDYYLGRFDGDLVLVDRSVIAVNPYTTIAFGGGRIYVQTSDDRIVALSSEDLRIAP